jgi:hypothetical protein
MPGTKVTNLDFPQTLLSNDFIITHNFVSDCGYSVSRDSAVGIVTGYGLDDRGVGVRVPVGSRTFSSPRRPDRLWGPPSLSILSNGYRELFRRG